MALPGPYFILGNGRSGTTSLTRILDRAAGGLCLNEPMTVTARQSRMLYEGRLADPFAIIARQMLPPIADCLDRGIVYGEKSLFLGPFVPYLHALLRAKFLLTVRDGREVVRSWLDWHNLLYGQVFRECADPGSLAPRALEWVARYPVPTDGYDQGRLRPLPGDPWHDPWMELSRLEMIAWSWARTNDLILDHLQALPPDLWRLVDYSRIDADFVLDIAAFVGLTGLDKAFVAGQLERRINALSEHGATGERHPAWQDWSPAQKVAFDAIAAPTMRRLGYYPQDHRNFCPPAYDPPPPPPLSPAEREWLAARPEPDGILSQAALQTAPDLDHAVAEKARDTRSWLAVSLPERLDPLLRGHRHRWRQDGFANDLSLSQLERQLAQAGFAVRERADLNPGRIWLAERTRS